MNVRDLIAELQKFDLDKEVYIRDDTNNDLWKPEIFVDTIQSYAKESELRPVFPQRDKEKIAEGIVICFPAYSDGIDLEEKY